MLSVTRMVINRQVLRMSVASLSRAELSGSAKTSPKDCHAIPLQCDSIHCDAVLTGKNVDDELITIARII